MQDHDTQDGTGETSPVKNNSTNSSGNAKAKVCKERKRRAQPCTKGEQTPLY